MDGRARLERLLLPSSRGGRREFDDGTRADLAGERGMQMVEKNQLTPASLLDQAEETPRMRARWRTTSRRCAGVWWRSGSTVGSWLLGRLSRRRSMSIWRHGG
ncbi:putative proline-rich receptor-like protein kinase PERK3 [Iris pallida]|uniref:Proline-rich receptor-like protein kinase PERK3 n=1 Tax=Iris pallida TaxID=29817 RepID=A0AAX6G9T3_IRIPA|nr:putative proline-rich receptor-like protein kinase PERK3 [Iris pallida]